MADKMYEQDLEPGVVLRSRFTTERGQVVNFTVQLELADDTGARPVRRHVVRYDAAHGEAHIDYIDPQGVTYRKEWLNSREPYNETLTLAINDLTTNYRAHIARFREMEAEREHRRW